MFQLLYVFALSNCSVGLRKRQIDRVTTQVDRVDAKSFFIEFSRSALKRRDRRQQIGGVGNCDRSGRHCASDSV